MKVVDLIQKYSFLLLGISLSLPIHIQSKAIFLFSFIIISISIVKKYRFPLHGFILPALFILFFLTGLISLSYSSNIQSGLNKISTQLSLVLIPLIVLIYGKDRIFNLSRSFYRGVIIGNLFLILYILIRLLYTIIFTDIDNVSSNSVRIVDYILQGYNHRTYLGIVLIAGYITLCSNSSTPNLKYPGIYRMLYALLLWAIIFLLGTRSILMLYSILLVLQITLSGDIKRSIFLALISVVIFGLIFSFHPRLSKFISFESISIHQVLETNVRMDIWAETWELIKCKPIWGYGLGDGTDKVIEATSLLESVNLLELKPNAHNQFLQSWLDSGIISFLIIMGIFIAFVIINKKMPAIRRIGLPLLFLFAMLFESILHRLSGVILFSTFMLFPFSSFEIKSKTYNIFNITTLTSFALLMLFWILSQNLNIFNPIEPKTYMPLPHAEIAFQDLPGKIPEEIPVGTKGCQLGSSSFEKQLQENLYAQSIINEFSTTNGDSILLSLYCYITESFNGDEVRISGREQVKEPNDKYANLSLRDQWQFLSIKSTAAKGRALFVVTLGKHNTYSQDSIKGDVIIAYPQVTRIKRNRNNNRELRN